MHKETSQKTEDKIELVSQNIILVGKQLPTYYRQSMFVKHHLF